MRLDEFQALSLHPLQKRNALWVFRFEKKWRPLRPFKSCKIFNVVQVCLTRLDSTSAALKYLLPIKSAISKRSATVSTLKRPTIIWSNPNNQRSTVNNACVTMCHSMHAFPQDKLANLGQQLQIATVSLPAHSAQPGQALHNDVQPPNSQGSRDPKFSQSWTTATTWLAREGILENDTCHSCHVMYSTWSSRRFTVLQGRQVEDKLKISWRQVEDKSEVVWYLAIWTSSPPANSLPVHHCPAQPDPQLLCRGTSPETCWTGRISVLSVPACLSGLKPEIFQTRPKTGFQTKALTGIASRSLFHGEHWN